MGNSKKLHLGEKIRLLRILAGMNQHDLAEKIGKTRGMVSHIERQGKINHYTLKDIAKALDTSIEEIENYKTIDVAPKKIANSSEFSIESLKREIQLLKELVEYQKKVIDLLEKKS